MSASDVEWSHVLGRVPEVGEFAPVDRQEIADVVGALPPSGSSRTAHLVAVQSIASGPARGKIEGIRARDVEQRRSIARKRANDVKKAFALFPTLLLTVVGIALLSPAAFDLIDIGIPTLIVGMVTVIALLANVYIERRPAAPRSLPYGPVLYIVYAVLQAIEVVFTALRVSDEELWVDPAAIMGVILAALSSLGFVGLFFWSRRRPTMLQWLHSDTPEGRELDDALRERVAKVIRGSRGRDMEAIRARAVEGVRLLSEIDRVDEDDAVWMLREIMDAGGDRSAT